MIAAKGGMEHFKGKAAQAGAYVYVTTVEFEDGKEAFKGTITLIR